jgi:serine/threonine protein kinase
MYIPNLGTRFRVQQVLDTGSYGQVSRAEDIQTGIDVAIKTFTEVESFVSELSFYASLDHPNIAKLIAWSFDPGQWYLVLPLGTSSRDAIGNKLITLDHAIHDLMSGIAFLHHHGIYHGDIKDWNFIFYQGRMVFVDFGNTVRATPIDGKWYVRYVLSTPGYVDPEFYPDDWNPIESELYAIAGVIWDFYLITRGRPKEVVHMFGPYQFITSNTDLNKLLLALTSYPVKDRKSAEQIWNEWNGNKSMGLPLTPGKYLQNPSPKCYTEDNVVIQAYLDALGNYKIYPPVSARAFFAGATLYRTVSKKLLDMDNPIQRLEDCVAITGCIFSDIDVCSYPNINDILVASDGMVIMKNLWDTAANVDDLKSSVRKMVTCSGVEVQHIVVSQIKDKNVQLSTIWKPLSKVHPFDYTSRFMNISEFTRRVRAHFTDVNDNYFFFLHFKKFLPELSDELAREVFDRLNQNDFRRRLLAKILEFEVNPSITMKDFIVQPFQLSMDDYNILLK